MLLLHGDVGFSDWGCSLYCLLNIQILGALSGSGTIPQVMDMSRSNCDTLVLTGHMPAPPAQNKRLGNENVN